jgi:rubrerythrin
MLKKNKHSHPMIYMRGLKAKDLTDIVDVIYLGEANIYQEDLDAFLALAEELQLKGLSQNNASDNKQESAKKSPPQRPRKTVQEYVKPDKFHETQEIKVFGEIDNWENQSLVPADGTTMTEVKTIARSKNAAIIDYEGGAEELENKKKSMMTKVNNIWSCTVCGKTTGSHGGSFGNLKVHIENSHIEGVAYFCDKCDYTSRSRNTLSKHNFRHHN